MQPVNLRDQLETNQPMKKPEIIVANRTHRMSNHRCESSEDKAPVGESPGRTGVRASNLTTASSQFCSTVSTATRIRFKWSIKCDEPFVPWRSQYIQARRVCAPGWHFGAGEVARSQGLIGKAGSIRIPPRAKKGEGCSGMRNANAACGNGDSDQAMCAKESVYPAGESPA